MPLCCLGVPGQSAGKPPGTPPRALCQDGPQNHDLLAKWKLHWLKQNFSNTLRTKTLVGGWGKGWWPCPAAALKNHHSGGNSPLHPLPPPMLLGPRGFNPRWKGLAPVGCWVPGGSYFSPAGSYYPSLAPPNIDCSQLLLLPRQASTGSAAASAAPLKNS